MGQIRSKLYSYAGRYNIENRAFKEMERKKTVAEAAPKHSSTNQSLAKFRTEHPEYLEAVSSKNEGFHQQLKGVYLKSSGDHPVIKPMSKPLQHTNRKEVTEYGIMDIEYQVPEGRAELKTAIKFISEHHQNPETVTAASIAESYTLNVQDVENVLTHFKVLNMYIPQEYYEADPKLEKIVKKNMETGKTSSSINLPKIREENKKVEAGDDVSIPKT